MKEFTLDRSMLSCSLYGKQVEKFNFHCDHLDPIFYGIEPIKNSLRPYITNIDNLELINFKFKICLFSYEVYFEPYLICVDKDVIYLIEVFSNMNEKISKKIDNYISCMEFLVHEFFSHRLKIQTYIISFFCDYPLVVESKFNPLTKRQFIDNCILQLKNHPNEPLFQPVLCNKCLLKEVCVWHMIHKKGNKRYYSSLTDFWNKSPNEAS